MVTYVNLKQCSTVIDFEQKDILLKHAIWNKAQHKGTEW